MSRLQRFRIWVKASPYRYALFWAFSMSVGVPTIEALRHYDTASFRGFASSAIEWFVVSYPLGLLMALPSRSKRPS